MTRRAMHDVAGFPPEAMVFLQGLRDNNDRAWFAAHRNVYEDALKAPGEAFAEAMRARLEALTERPTRAKIFRLHRDVRFSRDKSPYNAHLHIAFLGAEAEKGGGPGFYVGLEPDRLVLGAGVFELASPDLDRYRAAVADPEQGAVLASILDGLAAADFRLEGPTLKRTPAPYPVDHPNAELLRRKGVTAWRDITAVEVITGPRLVEACALSFKTLAPLQAWLMRALEPQAVSG